jgi:hypothetical protein
MGGVVPGDPTCFSNVGQSTFHRLPLLSLQNCRESTNNASPSSERSTVFRVLSLPTPFTGCFGGGEAPEMGLRLVVG